MVLPVDDVTIFSKGGVVLWSRAVAKLKGDPLNALIQTVLLEEKGGATLSATIDSYSLQWRLVNDAGVVIVVTCQTSLELAFVGELLDSIRAKFVSLTTGCATDAARSAALARSFDSAYEGVELEMESRLRLRRKADKKPTEAPSLAVASAASAKDCARVEAEAAPDEADCDASVEAKDSVLNRMQKRGCGPRSGSGGSRRATGKKGSEDSQAAAAPSEKGSKKPTVWRDGSQRNKKLTAKEAAKLDFSSEKDLDPAALEAADRARTAEMRGTYLPSEGEAAAWDEDEGLAPMDDEDDEDESAITPAKKSWFAQTRIGGLLDNARGTATLSAAQIEPLMDALRDRLMEKNVAAEIADDITRSVTTTLVGQKVERFARAKTMVRDALVAAVERVLTPGRSTDVLREVLAAKGRRKGPYSIVFVGINGVGKSTTLSKVAYYLKQHGVDLMMTACDTFRSGAVEQLRSHAKCLDVELYEKGYLKDPAEVAKSSLEHAKATKKECVLIDTAGRMQNNDKLMRELAKLVSINDPDLILFVGEALVGNDGIDQLNMFNKSLGQHCPNGRQIDGLVLTKFDTIDDKVGATLSMTYKTGQPIMFIGVGQKYTHLKKLSVNHVVNALFS